MPDFCTVHAEYCDLIPAGRQGAHFHVRCVDRRVRPDTGGKGCFTRLGKHPLVSLHHRFSHFRRIFFLSDSPVHPLQLPTCLARVVPLLRVHQLGVHPQRHRVEWRTLEVLDLVEVDFRFGRKFALTEDHQCACGVVRDTLSLLAVERVDPLDPEDQVVQRVVDVVFVDGDSAGISSPVRSLDPRRIDHLGEPEGRIVRPLIAERDPGRIKGFAPADIFGHPLEIAVEQTVERIGNTIRIEVADVHDRRIVEGIVRCRFLSTGWSCCEEDHGCDRPAETKG